MRVGRNFLVPLRHREPGWFPDPRRGPLAHVPLAVGGDLSPARLLAAYDQGFFPWYSAGDPLLWWSPHPRAVLFPPELHVPRRLGVELRRAVGRVTRDVAFEAVMAGCGDRDEGTWIDGAMTDAYVTLHRLGHAHSFEVWSEDGDLAGGLYGVRRGGLFAAESMFHARDHASKVALVAATRTLAREGVAVIDVQFSTPHLARFGVREIARDTYLDLLGVLTAHPTTWSGEAPLVVRDGDS